MSTQHRTCKGEKWDVGWFWASALCAQEQPTGQRIIRVIQTVGLEWQTPYHKSQLTVTEPKLCNRLELWLSVGDVPRITLRKWPQMQRSISWLEGNWELSLLP